jgi:hypothetical protein
MVEGKDDKAVTYENSETGFGSHRIVKGVDCLIYIGDTDVAGKSVSHHNRHSAWHRTELRRVYRDTGMMETDCVTGAYGDQGWRRWTE